MTRILPILALVTLAACGGNETRYPVEAAPAAGAVAPAPVRVRVSTIEVRDVVLPAYAEDSQMQTRGADGGLLALRGAQWAAPSAQAITAELARSLDLGSSASVAAEPWPLNDPADIRIEVRIDRLLPGADGRFEMGGQYAVSSLSGVMREFIERFDVTTPMGAGDPTPAALAAAYGASLAQLRDQILARLAR